MSRTGSLGLILAGACFVLASSRESWAQASTAALQGVVMDSQGGVLPGAAVSMQSNTTGLQREAQTSRAGVYVVNFLPPGSYTVIASLQGFKTVKRERVTLEVGQSRTLDFSLEVGGVAEVVSVIGEAPVLDRSSPSIATVIGAGQLKELPLNGRHWASLMMLAPGAINTGSGSHATIRFLGRANDDNNFTFDGVDASGVKDPKQESIARLIISMDSIAEFRVSSSMYSAASGSGAGGQVQLISKAGTNRFRGSLFDFVRNDRFDSRAFGDTGDPPPFTLNQFGANLGGPIVKNKTFFFANYEGIRERLTETFTGFVPSAAFRASVAPALAPIVAAYPAGTGRTSDAGIDEWVVQRKAPKDEDAFMARLDHRFSDKMSAYVRYNQNRALIETPLDVGALRTDHFTPSNLIVQFQQIVSPNVVNELKLGINRSRLDRDRKGAFHESFGVPGFTALTGSDQLLENGRSFSLLDDLAIVRGRHNLKVGSEIRRILIDVGDGGSTSLTYSSRPNFAANGLNAFSIVDFDVSQGQRWYYFGYLQDDFKVTPALTLNLGLRYEYYSVAKEKDGKDKVFRVECGGYCPPGTPWYDADKNNLAPRVGLAWSPKRFRGKTVLRGGFGLFYGPGQNDDVFAPLDNAETRLSLDVTQVASLSYPITPFLARAGEIGVAPRAVDADREDLYAEHYSLSVQQELPWRFVTQVGYVGNQGHHLFSRSFVNVIDPATGRRPVSGFSAVDTKNNDGNSNFNGLQVSLHRQLVNGLLVGAQYMWSHSINDRSVGGGEAGAPQNINDRRADRGNSAEDIRHTATVNGIWELPVGKGRQFLDRSGVANFLLGGWQLSGLVQARTGRMLTITVTRSAADLPDGNSGGQRPNLVPGVSLAPPSGQTPQQWINPAAFAVPARGTWGNAGRSIMTGPGLFQVDLGLQKQFVIRADRNVAFRWEIFNIFNRENLANPGTNISAPASFGRITGPLTRGAGTGSPRQMQFMFRLNF